MNIKYYWVLLAGIFISSSALAEEYVIIEKDKKFFPPELLIPAGQKIKLIVRNDDPSPAEFESNDFNREKIVEANNGIIVYIGPLDRGTYTYFDDFHRESTGRITAK